MAGTHKQVAQVTVAANDFPDNLLCGTPRISAVASIPEQCRVVYPTVAVGKCEADSVVLPITTGINGSTSTGGTLVGLNTVRRFTVEVFHNGAGIGCELIHPFAVIAHVVTGRNGSGGTSGGSHCTDSSGGVLCRPVKEGNVHRSILSGVGVLKALLRHGRFDRLILTSLRFSFTRSSLPVFRGALFGGVLLIGTSLNIILNDGRIGLLTVIGILRVFCGVVDQIAVARTSLSNLRRVRNTSDNDRIAAAIRV